MNSHKWYGVQVLNNVQRRPSQFDSASKRCVHTNTHRRGDKKHTKRKHAIAILCCFGMQSHATLNTWNEMLIFINFSYVLCGWFVFLFIFSYFGASEPLVPWACYNAREVHSIDQTLRNAWSNLLDSKFPCLLRLNGVLSYKVKLSAAIM